MDGEVATVSSVQFASSPDPRAADPHIRQAIESLMKDVASDSYLTLVEPNLDRFG